MGRAAEQKLNREFVQTVQKCSEANGFYDAEDGLEPQSSDERYMMMYQFRKSLRSSNEQAREQEIQL